MKLNIKDKVAEIVMDVSGFKDSFKRTFSIMQAVKESCRVSFNLRSVSEDKLLLILYGETNWLFFFSKLRETTKKEIIFKLHEIEFHDRFSYASDERNENYSFVSLSPVRKSGRDYILINSLIRTPEAFIDFWLQKRVYNYTNSEFKKVIYEIKDEH